jgi:hypothetical protein
MQMTKHARGRLSRKETYALQQRYFRYTLPRSSTYTQVRKESHMIRVPRVAAQSLAFIPFVFAPALAQIRHFAYVVDEFSNSVSVHSIDPTPLVY